jgi:hypothetical protein
MCGLRRREIDLLEWSSFIWNEGLLRVQTTQYFEAKSEDSLADIPVEAELMELFRGWYTQASGPFVIESDQEPRPVLYNFYRAEAVFARLIQWLRQHGVSAPKSGSYA